MGGIAVLVLFLCIGFDTVEGIATDCLFEKGSDCCHFKYKGSQGNQETQCSRGSVWNQGVCNCDWPDKLGPSETPCNPDVDCNIVDTVTAKSCPDELEDDECCINGEVYRATDNETQYQQGGSNLTCPFGQVFSAEDCCCEGKLQDPINGKCMYWDFEGNLTDYYQRIPIKRSGFANFDSRDGLPNKGNYIQLDEMGSLFVERLADAYLGTSFSIAFFVRFDGLFSGENRATSVFSNGDEVTQDYDNFPPTIFLTANDGARGKVDLGGGISTGRTKEIKPFSDVEVDENEWVFITMVYDNNKLKFTAGDEEIVQSFDGRGSPMVIRLRPIPQEKGAILSSKCPFIFGGVTLDVGMAIDELLICQETGLTSDQLEAFRDDGTLP